MNKVFIGLVCLLLGLGIGYVVFTPGESLEENNIESMPLMQNKDEHMMDMHDHATLEVDVAKPVPSVSVEAMKDAKDGYNLHIVTKNYKWTPEKVNQTPVQGEGHAHIYVNGEKIARLYGEWFNVPGAVLQSGKNEIKITLNANDHSEWLNNGEHIEAITVIEK